MKYNDLIVERNARPTRAGRGTKGQKARTGHKKMPATFMGGQRALMQAVPKLKGFKSLHKKAELVYTDNLNGLTGIVDNFILAEANLITTPYTKVKIITRGDLDAKIELKTQFASKTAIEMIKKAGGSFAKAKIPARPKAEDKAE